MITHSSTSRPVQCLYMAERTDYSSLTCGSNSRFLESSVFHQTLHSASDQGCRIDAKRACDDPPAIDRNTRASMCPSEEKKRQKHFVKGKNVFSTEEVLEIAREAEKKTAANRILKRRESSSVTVEITHTGVDMSESDLDDSESDCIVVASSRRL